MLLHRFSDFDAQQRRRAENFAILDQELRQCASLARLVQPPGVKRHGMYMYAMRYRPDRCGNATIAQFLEAVQAEGAPIHRLYTATISGQPAFLNLLERRPDFLRVLPTPVADEATVSTVYISNNIFLGAARDMKDIAAAIRKVEVEFSLAIHLNCNIVRKSNESTF